MRSKVSEANFEAKLSENARKCLTPSFLARVPGVIRGPRPFFDTQFLLAKL
jgi:hypothetical protein